MNLTQRNLVLLVLACGLAVPTYLQLRSEAETFVDLADIPLMFDGFTSDNAGVIVIAAPKDPQPEQPAANPQQPKRVAYDQLRLQWTDKGWVFGAEPGQVPGDLVGAPVQARVVEGELFQHLRSIRSDRDTLVQPDATPEQLAEYGLDEEHALLVQVTDKAGRNVVASLCVGAAAGGGRQGTEAVQGVFVRAQDSDDVVLYETTRPWRLQLDKQRWLDRTLARVRPETVRKLSILNLSTKGEYVVFERPQGRSSWECKQPPAGRGAVRQTEVEGLLQLMGFLSAQSYVRPLTRAGDMQALGLFPKPQVGIVLEMEGADTRTLELKVGNKLDDANEYYLTCSDSDFLLTWPSSTVTRFELDVAQRLFDPKGD